jgi:DNA (cytosine-5)-methyltransferase 1
VAAYYNEHDQGAAAWLRELIRIGAIAPGDVDGRSISQVCAADLGGYTQCHFFAGIGGWAYALRLANWPDDRPIWTGSCPCQPFSAAGHRRGAQDDRHLWPIFRSFIGKCCPPVVMGEQVSSPLGLAWFAAVRGELEALSYAVWAADLCAAGVGAPHIRQRIYWGGSHLDTVSGLRRILVRDAPDARQRLRVPADRRMGRRGSLHATGASGLAHAARARLEGYGGHVNNGCESRWDETRSPGSGGHVDFWAGVSAMLCRDGRTRPVPVADGISGGLDDGGPNHEPATALEHRRTAMIHGYGNAIVPQVAAEVIGAYMAIVDQE